MDGGLMALQRPAGAENPGAELARTGLGGVAAVARPHVGAQRGPILQPPPTLVTRIEGWRQRRHRRAAPTATVRWRRQNAVARLQMVAQRVDVGEHFAAEVADLAHAAVHLVPGLWIRIDLIRIQHFCSIRIQAKTELSKSISFSIFFISKFESNQIKISVLPGTGIHLNFLKKVVYAILYIFSGNNFFKNNLKVHFFY
jgi:hypothetical protein